MRTIFTFLAIAVLLLTGFRPGFGQVETQAVPVDQAVVPADVEEAGTAILTSVANFIANSQYVVLSTTIIVTVVSLLKLIPALKDIPAPTLTFAISVVVWIAGVLIAREGYEQEFIRYIGIFSEPVAAFGGLILSLLGAPLLHDQAAELGAPLIGYKRTPYR